MVGLFFESSNGDELRWRDECWRFERGEFLSFFAGTHTLTLNGKETTIQRGVLTEQTKNIET